MTASSPPATLTVSVPSRETTHLELPFGRPALAGPLAADPDAVLAQPPLWRLAYLLGAPLVPLVLAARMTRTVLEKRCRVRQFILALPLMVPALIVLVAGEWTGCLLGPGDTLSKVE